jgi:hypothetical protein
MNVTLANPKAKWQKKHLLAGLNGSFVESFTD